MKKKLVSLALSAAMVLSMMTPIVSAAGANGVGKSDLTNHGLQGDFYLVDQNNNFAFTTYKGTFVDPNIAFGNMETIIKDRTGASDYVGARWSGQLVAPQTGTYTFYIYSDNGFKVWLDGTEKISWWKNDWDKEQTFTVDLVEGQPYNFKVEWFEATGGSHVTMRWSNNKGLTKTVIPESAFYLPADFNGPMVDSIDLSNAQLDKDAGELSGTIGLSGKNLTADTTVEIVNLGGKSLKPPVFANVSAATESGLTFDVPSSLKVGIYKTKLTSNGINMTASTTFAVTSATAEANDRPEHPRPDWKREKWMNLNGWWDFTFDPGETGVTEKWYEDKDYDLKINVPFPWEAPMSGVENTSYRGTAWYEREINLDSTWDGQNIFLKFGAVDWKCSLWVNGTKVADHEGGYTPFEFDITDYVITGKNKVTLMVEDKSSFGDDSYPALVGKQGHNAPCGYTHTSGIWQTVYLEGRSNIYMDYAHANPDIDNSSVQYDLKIQSDSVATLDVVYDFKSVLWDDEKGVNIETGSTVKGEQSINVVAGENLISLESIVIENQKLWNYDEANLYDGTIKIYDGNRLVDEVSTYFGQRKVSTDKYDGRDYEYIYVNNEPVFLSGLLDQGFWEEGIYTAPSEEALKYDIKAMRDRDFNMIRKHLKIEDPLQYFWADRLGMFVWQDMPHATYMNPKTNGGAAPGRTVFEYGLEKMMDRNYNHPSIIAVMLFNETWGINYGNGWDRKADDGLNAVEWIQRLYKDTQAMNPNILIEDMSPCNQDHVQPTDINTFHMYPKGYRNSKNDVDWFERNTFPGSTNNFKFGYKQDGAPWLNSEFGGVAAYDGDWDVSWCFKYQTDIQRQYQKLNGFVYTEPYDVEYERNGILTYDRRDKIFGYEDVAYGGDMTINDLTKPEYIGLDIDPALKMIPGTQYTAPVITIKWSNDKIKDPVVKWRFDATDIYGNSITTGQSGEFPIEYKPFTRESNNISFMLPDQKAVGTITVWVEDADGNVITKNFVNVIATDNKNSPSVDFIGDNTVALRQVGSKPTENTVKNGVGAVSYTYDVPASFDAETLNSMRIIAEASSLKGATPTNSANAQTTVGSELPSDLTVSVNGVEIDTVVLPDNPRDIRGTLTLPQGLNGGSSAGNFGYLLNLDVDSEDLEAIKATVADTGRLVVSYGVEADAENANGVRMYSEDNGRYAVNPTIILNPEDAFVAEDAITVTDDTTVVYGTETLNYSAEALIDGANAGLAVRYNGETGYVASVAADGETATLTKADGTVIASANGLGLGAGAHNVKVTLFDEHITVFADNNPVPVLDVYDYSEYTGGVAVKATGTATFTGLVVAPETYAITEGADVQADVQFVDSFSPTGQANDPKYSKFADRYTLIKGDKSWPNDPVKSEGVWNYNDGSNTLKVDLDWGNKAIIKNTESTDVIAEADITLTANKGDNNGNLGFVIRGSEFLENVDGANGYYAGVGIQQQDDSGKGFPRGQGFIEVGRMHNGWTALAKVPVDVAFGETHRLKVVAVGPRIRVYLDDQETPFVDVYDATYTSGSVALRGFNSVGVYDNVVVSTAPRYEADFENGKSSEWQIAGSWNLANGAYNASGNNVAALVGNAGWNDYELSANVTLATADAKAGLALRSGITKNKVSGYSVALDAENDKIAFVKMINGTSSTLAQADMAVEEGTAYKLTVRAVNNGFRVYVGDAKEPVLLVNDNDFFSGKAGLAVLQGGASFDDVAIKDKFIFEENFSDGTLNGWNVVDDYFSVADNTLTLRDATGKKMLDGYATWDNYVMRANIKLNVRSDMKSNAGFIFRTSDPTPGQDNQMGYVLGINHHPKAERPEDGSGIEFGDIRYGWRAIRNENDFQIDPSKWYNFEVRAIDNVISVYVDGHLYYEQEDDVYSNGAFGIRNFNAGMQVKNLEIIPADQFNENPDPEPTTFEVLLSDVNNVVGTAGTEFTLPVNLSKYPADIEYKAIESVMTLPEGIEFVGAVASEHATYGAFDANADGKTLRFAFISNDKNPVTFDATNGGALVTLKFKLTSDIAEDSQLPINVDRFTVKSSDTQIDYLLEKAKANINVVVPVDKITVDARELFTGDDVDVIPADKKAVAIEFTGIVGTENIVMGDTPLYFSSELTAKAASGVFTYVALVDANTDLADLEAVDAYTIDAATATEKLIFGKTDDNYDVKVNAQDALNTLDAWLRRTTPSEKQMIIMNVNGDARIDTADVIAIVDNVISNKEFAILAK